MKIKKPKFWDRKKPNLFAYLLFPLAFLFQLIKDRSKKNNLKKLKIKTICIGNIYIGGTGKTSLSIKLNELLIEKKIRCCFIKKFYKNQKDEQKLLHSKGKLFVSNKRIDAIKQAESENYNVAILDDGLQDSSIDYDLNFVCFNTINWIGNGMTIPSGPLREKIENLRNYQHIFLNGNLENLDFLKEQVYKINPNIIVHIGKYKPINLENFHKSEKYLVFSGIGNHQTFISMIKSYGLKILKDMEFPDHYEYRNSDINKILNEAKKLNCKVITTEKDYFRINSIYLNEILCMKIELEIVDKEKFLKAVI